MPDTEMEIEIDPAELDPSHVAGVTVVVDKDGGKDPVVVTKPDADLTDDVENQLKTLKDSEAAARRVAADADARARAAAADADRSRREADHYRAESVASGEDAITQAIEAAKSRIASARSDYKTAMEAGDYDKASEAQAVIGEASAEKVQYERDKRDMETRKTQPRQEQRVQEPTDPVERVIVSAQQRGQPFSQRAQSWLREHPDVVTDQEKFARVSWADASARKAGITPDTDAYFEHVEKIMGYRESEETKPARTDAQPQPVQRRTMPSAPVSRTTATANGGVEPTKVSLTAGEVAAATDGTHKWSVGPEKGKPIGVKEMARRKAILTREGKYQNFRAQ